MDKNLEAKQAFLMDNKSRFSPETTRGYNISLNQFFSFIKVDYDEVLARHIRAWLTHLKDEGLKPKSISTKLSAVKSFYEYCLEEDLIKKDPTDTVRNPKKEDDLPKYLSKRQLALLKEHTRDVERDRAIVEALYVTGARISEILNVHLEDVSWDTRQIWIREGKGNKERFVLFTQECAVRLKAYLKNRNDQSPYLFSNGRGGKLSPVTIQRKFQEYVKVLGFKVTPHTMRHTFAAHLCEKKMPESYIQDLMGHENINSTHIYTRLTGAARKKQYDQYHS